MKKTIISFVVLFAVLCALLMVSAAETVAGITVLGSVIPEEGKLLVKVENGGAAKKAICAFYQNQRLVGSSFNDLKTGTQWLEVKTPTENYTNIRVYGVDERFRPVGEDGLVKPSIVHSLTGYIYILQDRGYSNLSTYSAVVEILYLDGSGIEVLPLPTRTQVVNGENQRQFYANNIWTKVEDSLGLAGAFYGYYINENDEIVLLPLELDKAAAIYGSRVKYRNSNIGSFGGNTNYVLSGGSQLVAVNKENGTINVIVGSKNIGIDMPEAEALIVFDNRIVKTLYVLDAVLEIKDTYAYFAGTTYQNSKGTWITMYVDGEPIDYLFSKSHINKNQVIAEMLQGAYIVETNGDELLNWSKLKNSEVNLESEKVLVTGANDLFFKATDGDHYFAEDAEVFDITNNGAKGQVKAGDYVVYENSEVNKILATKVWIVGNENDSSGDSYKVSYMNLTNTSVDIIAENPKDRMISVRAYRMINNTYSNYGGYTFDGTTFMYIGKEANDLYIDVYVGGTKAGRLGPFAFDSNG